MLSRIFKNIKKRRDNTTAVQDTSQQVSIWRDTGQVYYLENTIKLTYQSKAGAVTIEKLSIDRLHEVVKELQALNENSTLARAEVANQTDAFNISVCGVTWQKSEDGKSVRIKALPEAALLRSPTACFTKSQAVFKHAFMLEHDDLLTPSTSGKPGIHTYNRISINQFTQQLANANARLAPTEKKKITVGFDNFSTAFTAHEQSVIDALIQPEATELKETKSEKPLTKETSTSDTTDANKS